MNLNPSEDSVTWDTPNQRPSGPAGLPVLGNTLSCIRQPMSFFEELREYGDVVLCNFPKIRAVTLFHPEHIEDVLVTNQDDYRRWNFDELRAIVGNDFAPEGLAFNEGDQWRKQRHLLQPMFGLNRLRGYADAMVESAERTVETWDDGEVVTLNHAFSDLTLEVLTHSLFDLDVRERGEVVPHAAEVLNNRARMQGLGLVELLLPSWIPTPGNNRYRETMNAFDETVDRQIAKRRANPSGYDDLLARMLTTESDEGYTLSDSEIHDQMLTFLFAGHETTATALTFTWLLLATHPEKRGQLETEVENVLEGASPSPADLEDLTYTEHIIKEALRLYPPAAMLFRETIADTEIGEYTIPEGTKILLPQFVVHSDERWYIDPEQFRPERWNEETGPDRPEYAYFPFGGGRHHCIGMRFAMMELKHIVPIIAQRVDFELLSEPNPKVQMEMTLQSTEDIQMRVHKR